MGYYSEVVIYMNKPAMMQFVTDLKGEDEQKKSCVISELEYADNIFVADNGDIIIKWHSTKWYNRDGVVWIENEITKISNDAEDVIGDPPPEVIYLRLGKNDDDVESTESSTSTNPYNIYIRREISIDTDTDGLQSEEPHGFFTKLLSKKQKKEK